MAEREHERRSIWRVGPESTWTTVVPVIFIIASLLSLVLLPLIFGSHTAQMRREIAAAEPARHAANEAQLELSTELDQIISYQFTGQSQFVRGYRQRLATEAQDYSTLAKSAPKLSPEVEANLKLLASQTATWHRLVASGELVTRQLPAEVFVTRLFEAHPRYDDTLRTAAALEVSIQQAIDERLARIRDAEKLSASLTIILTLLALTSALLVAGLGRQMRLLAREAMGRRQEAEREAAHAQLARAAAEREERRAAFLATAGQELASSLDYEHALSTLAKLIVPNLAEACAIDVAGESGELRRGAVAHRDAETERALAERVGRAAREVPETLVRVMSDREPRIIGATSTLLAFAGLPDDVQRSLLAVPLVSRGQTLGVMLAAAGEGQVFTREDAALFAELSRHGSLAIDNARLYRDSQQAVRAREEVLAIVSHDLRNPLNAVMLAAALLQTSEQIAPDDREQLDIIDLSAKRMRRLIEDLLDVTRLEGGKQLPIDPAPLEVESLFHDTYELFKAQAATAGVELHCRLNDGVPRVLADKHRIMQVLSNLVGNALKFTPAGGTIDCQATPQDQAVLFTVADSGPGIPKENLGDIFNPYWQAKRTARLGAGLGLPIAKGIVESHGGTIWVESVPGDGAKFFFTLPVARGDVSAAEEPAASASTP